MSASLSGAPVILWFRGDLRLRDNPALAAACSACAPIIPVYVLDDANAGHWKPGGASRWWLHESLTAMAARIPLVVTPGDARKVIPKLASDVGARAVYWNRRYEPDGIACDKAIEAALKQDGRDASSFQSSLLFEPWRITNAEGNPFKVFTPYARACQRFPVRPPDEKLRKPAWLDLPRRCGVETLNLMPRIAWYTEIAKTWQPGEEAANKRLKTVVKIVAGEYQDSRDFPAVDGTSRLSPHLHFGEISPHTVWHSVRALLGNGPSGPARSAHAFLRQLIWREFCWHLLYHFPQLPEQPWNPRFSDFPWCSDEKLLHLWQKGLTGYPIVDAGMRQLWRTGWMHNRVRMIAGSFLVKNLLQDWRDGEAWFWDTLVDADLGNNAAGWQWIAGCGADAAPYFRIFNPVLQSKKFDPNGDYIRTFVPELRTLSSEHIHEPWSAPAEVLRKAGVALGRNYPSPLVDASETRARALEAYAHSRGR